MTVMGFAPVKSVFRNSLDDACELDNNVPKCYKNCAPLMIGAPGESGLWFGNYVIAHALINGADGWRVALKIYNLDLNFSEVNYRICINPVHNIYGYIFCG